LFRLNAPNLALIGVNGEEGRAHELSPELGQVGTRALKAHPRRPKARSFSRRALKRRLFDGTHEDRLRPRWGRRTKAILNLLNLLGGVVLSVVLMKNEAIAQRRRSAILSDEILVLIASNPEEERYGRL
jgi:hypothetical protein